MSRLEALHANGVEKKSILLDIVFTVITFGLFNLWVQFRQIQDSNEILERNDISLTKVVIFSILTFGIYFCYHEYLLTRRLYEFVENEDGEKVGVLAFIATFFGLWFIVDSYQQDLMNAYLTKLDD